MANFVLNLAHYTVVTKIFVGKNKVTILRQFESKILLIKKIATQKIFTFL